MGWNGGKSIRFVMAGNEEEVIWFCNQQRVDRDSIIWLQTADQLKGYSREARLRIQRTGSWYLGNKDDLEEIEAEIEFRRDQVES